MSEAIQRIEFTCFFCEKKCVHYQYQDMYPPEMRIAVGNIGNKVVCANCIIELRDLLDFVEEAEEEVDLMESENELE